MNAWKGRETQDTFIAVPICILTYTHTHTHTPTSCLTQTDIKLNKLFKSYTNFIQNKAHILL